MFEIIAREFHRACHSIGLGHEDDTSHILTLQGKPSETGSGERVSVLLSLIEVAAAKEQHIDGLRQRNITIALAIFAGLFGFGLRSPGATNGYVLSGALALLMLVFAVLDRQLHMRSHGWRHTRWELTECAAQVINNPDQVVEFARYRKTGEKEAEWDSLQPVAYYLLVMGGLLSHWIFR